MVELYDQQQKAVEKMHNGCILVGDVGTGKSRTALAYFYLKECGGRFEDGSRSLTDLKRPRDLYIITTAKKRDSLEWLDECAPFHICTDPSLSVSGIRLTVDSWNNIKKYDKVFGAFFIFDEQRVVGSGAWVKAFLKITRKNRWVLLSATPADTWSDYAPVFIANGFYKNVTDFRNRHVVYDRFAKYPKIDRYVETQKLIGYRNKTLVHMKSLKTAEHKHIFVGTEYDRHLYMRIQKDRWDPFANRPIKQISGVCYLLRRVVNSDPSRAEAIAQIASKHPRFIVFYNFDYELEILRAVAQELQIVCAEWNGQKHENIPTCDKWIYLVQYNAGAEGWNCITTDTLVFYSQSYSYRMTVQAAGRIDRLNTPYSVLNYYHLRSYASIDLAIARALKNKRNFNERSFAGV